MIKAKWRNVDRFHRSLIAVERNMDRTTGEFLEESAQMLVNIIRSSWSASTVVGGGAPPAVITGNLDSSVKTERVGRTSGGQFATTEDAKKRFVVIDTKPGSGKSYSQVLEETHPYVEPAIQTLEGQFINLAKRKIKFT